MQLVEDGFPELSRRLASLVSALDACTLCSVQGTQAQELSDKPLVTHFTEHEALLRLFLSLKGSFPSIRRRQTTFQTIRGTSSNAAFTSAVEEESTSSDQQQALSSSVFAEAPNPDALFDLHGTCVLLPSEIFSTNSKGNRNANNISTAAAAAGVQAQAPETELAELSQGLQARPSWAPASVQGLPPLHSGGWLPISHALLEMRGDARKIVPPTPLNVPLSTLAIERTPGAVTGFSSGGDGKGSGKSIGSLKDTPMKRTQKKDIPATSAGTDTISTKDKKTLLGSGTLWTLEELQLARDALLSLQGVYSSLLRLRGALAAAHALPHPAAAGILNRIERAATCRHRLQGFIDTFGSTHRTVNSRRNLSTTSTETALQMSISNEINNDDPVLSALAAGLNDILLSFSQQLSSLETSHATEWVHTINLAAADGGPGVRGKVLQGQGLSLTRVGVLTGKVQTMLRVLSSMFWCNAATIDGKNDTRCEWEVGQGPPRGTALLNLLCCYAEEAEEPYKEIFQYLFARAAQPYLLFLQQWACTTTEIDLDHPYSVLMPNKVLRIAQPVDFEDFALGGGTRKTKSHRPVAIPGNLPEFLSHVETPLLRAGVQLRLLYSIRNNDCKELVAALCRKNEAAAEEDGGAPGNINEMDKMVNIEDIFRYSFETPPLFDTLGFDVHVSSSSSGTFVEDDKEKVDISAAAAAAGGGREKEATSSLLLLLLLLPQTSLQIERLIKQNTQEEVQKTFMIDTWLNTLERERQTAKATERGTALGALTLATEAIAFKEAAKMEALSRKHSQKQELLKEQLEAIASVHLARGGGSVPVPGENAFLIEGKNEGKGNESERKTDIDEVYEQEEEEEEKEEAQDVYSIEVKEKKVVEAQSNRNISTPITIPNNQSLTAVPMSTIIETAFTSTISLHYRLISHACLSYFIDHLQLENHLSFLRCTFFLEAGDWADEFLKPLSSRITDLQPLSAHSVHGALQDSLSNSSLGKKSDFVVLASNLEAEVVAGPTAISSFFSCLERQQQQDQESNKRIVGSAESLQNSVEILAAGNLPRNRASAPVLVSPTALDGLDIVLLRYKTCWPLAALFTEDTFLAYAVVFSAMLRVRRVSAALTKIWGPLAPRLSEAPTIRPSEKTNRRVQKLRVFVRSASQLTAAVQYFQGLTTAGPTWEALSNAVSSSSGGGDHTKTISVSDLQELLEMHRIYVFTSAIQCLTICGKIKLQIGIDAALHAALTVASKIETATEAGRVASGPRSTEASWVHTLSNDTTWHTLETSIIEFESALKVIRKELTGVGASGPLAGLAAVL